MCMPPENRQAFSDQRANSEDISRLNRELLRILNCPAHDGLTWVSGESEPLFPFPEAATVTETPPGPQLLSRIALCKGVASLAPL